MSLAVLCAGAAKGLVAAVESTFTAETGATIDGTFGAVGALREKFLAGVPCDVIVLTAPLIDSLEHDGRVVPGSAAPLGTVRTGIAVGAGEPVPDIHDAASLRATLVNASRLLFPASTRDGRHPLRRRAAPPRHPRRCCRAHRDVPEWRGGDAGARAITRARRSRLHANHRNQRHGGRQAGRCTATGVRSRDALHGRGVYNSARSRSRATARAMAGRRANVCASRPRRLRMLNGVRRQGLPPAAGATPLARVSATNASLRSASRCCSGESLS